MRFRKLRIAWSVAWGIIAVLAILLWVRSYWRLEILQKPVGPQAYQTSSVNGRIAFAHVAAYSKLGERYINVVAGDAADWRKKSVFGFYYLADYSLNAVIVPHWFAAFVTAAVAVLPWYWRSWRFSLRTLLIATTLVAVVLGLIVWLR